MFLKMFLSTKYKNIKIISVIYTRKVGFSLQTTSKALKLFLKQLDCRVDFLSKGCFFNNLYSEILIYIVDLLGPTLSKRKSVSLNFYKSSLCLSIYPIVFF